MGTNKCFSLCTGSHLSGSQDCLKKFELDIRHFCLFSLRPQHLRQTQLKICTNFALMTIFFGRKQETFCINRGLGGSTFFVSLWILFYNFCLQLFRPTIHENVIQMQVITLHWEQALYTGWSQWKVKSLLSYLLNRQTWPHGERVLALYY